MNEALLTFLDKGTTGVYQTKGCLNLRTLVLRAENSTKDSLYNLRELLIALPPLENLHLLLEGSLDFSVLEGVVSQHHGQSLRSLIWHQRPSSISSIDRNYSIHTPESLMENISKHCVNLKALGTTLSWHGLTDPTQSEYCGKVCNFLSPIKSCSLN